MIFKSGELMNLKVKTFSILGLLLTFVLISGISSFYGMSKLINSLIYVTGPAWDAADGAMETSIAVEAEILSVQKILTPYAFNHPEFLKKQQQRLNEAKVMKNQAILRMEQSNLLTKKQISDLESLNKNYILSLKDIQSSYSEYETVNTRFQENFEKFQKFMTITEEFGDKAVEDLRLNPDKQISWSNGLSELWFAADGSMETQIIMLQTIYFLQLFIDSGGENKYLNALNQANSDITERVSSLVKHPLFLKNKPLDSQFKTLSYSQNLEQLSQEHMTLINSLVPVWQTYYQQLKNFNSKSEQLLNNVEELEKIGDSKVENELDNISSVKSLANTLVILSTIFSFIVALISGLVAYKKVIIPLVNMSNVLQSQKNDLTITLPITSKDEIGKLSQTLNETFSNERQIIKHIQQATSDLHNSAGELDKISTQTYKNVIKQEAETEQTATAMNEMAATIQDMARNAGIASEAANEAFANSNLGHEVIVTTKNNIDQLSHNIQNMSDAIKKLNDDTENITVVLDVIRGIAEQTNLLALNAAIEAARAGEQGRGFAVVADEVRSLAGKTQESTEEIQTTINNLLLSSKSVVDAMEESNQQSQQTVSQIIKAEQALDKILESVQRINDVNTGVASATEQQSVVAEQINRSVVTISHVSKETLDSSTTVNDTSSKISELSDSILEQVSVFKV